MFLLCTQSAQANVFGDSELYQRLYQKKLEDIGTRIDTERFVCFYKIVTWRMRCYLNNLACRSKHVYIQLTKVFKLSKIAGLILFEVAQTRHDNRALCFSS